MDFRIIFSECLENSLLEVFFCWFDKFALVVEESTSVGFRIFNISILCVSFDKFFAYNCCLDIKDAFDCYCFMAQVLKNIWDFEPKLFRESLGEKALRQLGFGQLRFGQFRSSNLDANNWSGSQKSKSQFFSNLNCSELNCLRAGEKGIKWQKICSVFAIFDFVFKIMLRFLPTIVVAFAAFAAMALASGNNVALTKFGQNHSVIFLACVRQYHWACF